MPLTHFKVDGELIPVADALAGALAHRYPRAYLRTIASERVLEEKPGSKLHVTGLLRGTRESFLRMIRDYAEDPDEGAFRVVGASAHTMLANHAGALEQAELAFPDEDVSGTLDMLEEDGTLWDYKTWGSFAVARALGIKKEGRGKDARFWRDPDSADLKDEVLQLNRYRMYAERMGLEVKDLRCFAIVRDGGLFIAKDRGVDQKTYAIVVPRAEDRAVEEYFQDKKMALRAALIQVEGHKEAGATQEEAIKAAMPPLCSPAENWEGRKCKGYCPVAEHCTNNPHLADKALQEF
jgi:hypothetical protein